MKKAAGSILTAVASPFSAMAFLGPSLAGMSRSRTLTPALARWAAIWAPMVPAPSTTAFSIGLVAF